MQAYISIQGFGVHHVFFADDLGIASIFYGLKSKLGEARYQHISLFYCSINKRHLFKKELKILQKHFPTQLFISFHSREAADCCGIRQEDIEAILNANTMQQIEFTISGNEAFVEQIKLSLSFLGIEKVQIQEQFFSE
jgi:ferredoxin-NADP reductase